MGEEKGRLVGSRGAAPVRPHPDYCSCVDCRGTAKYDVYRLRVNPPISFAVAIQKAAQGKANG